MSLIQSWWDFKPLALYGLVSPRTLLGIAHSVSISYQSNQLHATLGEFRLELGKGTELGGAGWSEIILEPPIISK